MSQIGSPPPTPPTPDPGKRPVPGAAGGPRPGATPGGPAKPGLRPPTSVNVPQAQKPVGVSGTPGAKPGMPARPASAAPSTPMPPIDQLQGRPIGRVLTKMGKVTREQIVEALTFQKSKGGALGRILIDLGYIKEADLSIALAAQRGYEWVELGSLKIDPGAIKAVPGQIATTNKVLPVDYREEGGV